ncbi:histidine phosphatase family protein [Rhodobacteraceae bacterium NNCM2]|nr:histidine phosphatase family protein [Coraliihabitans acroporae]
MTRIALLRHYPTDWNLERRLQGQIDRPLTDEARALLATLTLPPDWADKRVVASTLSRSVDTAQLLLPNREIERDARLVEIAWGAWEGKRAEDLLQDPESGFVPTGDMGWRDRPPGGESMADAWARVQPALSDIAAGPPAVLVLHKAIMRVILGFAAKWQLSGSQIEIKRGRLYPLTLRPNGMPAEPEAPVRLVPR